MNIVMMTNTYAPIVGGLEKSVAMFSKEYQQRGHRVLVVTPEMEDVPLEEDGIFRVSAIQNFNGTDFSVELPISPRLYRKLKSFDPQFIHSHHPFLIGDTALRIAAEYSLPLVFTHHTLYEENTHYVPGDSRAIKRFVIELATGYANMCDRVVAPSASVSKLIKRRGVKVPVEVVPTGIYTHEFAGGDRAAFRTFFDIPQDCFVIGTVGRMAAEKNIHFLAETVAQYCVQNDKAYFVLVGTGPSLDKIKKCFAQAQCLSRLIVCGVLHGKQLAHAYAAMDVFAFASHSETQGLVLAEAMAAGTPVVGVDAPGTRDVVRDQHNGRLIPKDDVAQFSEALTWIAERAEEEQTQLAEHCCATAREYEVAACVTRMLEVYEQVAHAKRVSRNMRDNPWKKAMRLLRAQTEIMLNMSRATGAAVRLTGQDDDDNGG